MTESAFRAKRNLSLYISRLISVSLVFMLLNTEVLFTSKTLIQPLSNPTVSYFASGLKLKQQGISSVDWNSEHWSKKLCVPEVFSQYTFMTSFSPIEATSR